MVVSTNETFVADTIDEVQIETGNVEVTGVVLDALVECSVMDVKEAINCVIKGAGLLDEFGEVLAMGFVLDCVDLAVDGEGETEK